jgi:hypothetical protein
MTDEWKQILEPPPGGLSRLIDAVRADTVPRRYRYLLPFAAVALFVVAIVIERHQAPEWKLREALTSAFNGRGQIKVENGAALELPTSRPDVRMFVIAQMPAMEVSN